MTKDEFIQEASLKYLSAFPSEKMEVIANLACMLADEVWKRTVAQEEPDVQTELHNDDSVLVLAKEMAKLVREEIGEKIRIHREAAQRNDWSSPCCIQYNGAYVRFINVCAHEKIKTVSELLACGRKEFRRKKNMGDKTIELVDKVLDSLYNIKTW